MADEGGHSRADAVDPPSPATERRQRLTPLDISALILGVVAFAVATTWAVIEPDDPDPPQSDGLYIQGEKIESAAEFGGAMADLTADVAKGFAGRVKDRVTARFGGEDDNASNPDAPGSAVDGLGAAEQVVADQPKSPEWEAYEVRLREIELLRLIMTPATIALGIAAIGIGGFSLGMGSSRAMGVTAIILGALSALMAVLLALASAILGVLALLMIAALWGGVPMPISWSSRQPSGYTWRGKRIP